MPHIGVQRFAASHAQHHGPQNNEGDAGVVQAKAPGVVGREGPQNLRMLGNMQQPQSRNGQEPQHHHRAKKFANASSPCFLHKEQGEQHQQGQRDDVGLELGRHHFQALHRPQHRDSGGDDPIAVEQTGAKNAHQEHAVAQFRAIRHGTGGQGQHGDQAPLAVVVRAQHQHHVFKRNNEGQRPKNQ